MNEQQLYQRDEAKTRYHITTTIAQLVDRFKIALENALEQDKMDDVERFARIIGCLGGFNKL